MGGILGTIGSVIGIASGVDNLMGGGSSSSASSSATQQATAPWWLSGGGAQASEKLKGYMGGPSASMPGFEEFNKQSLDATGRKLSASGLHASGAEQSALNTQSQGNMMGYWQQMVGSLGSLAGLGFNPAAGVQAGTGAGYLGAQNQQQGLTNVAGGLGQLRTIYGGSSAPNYQADSSGQYGSAGYNPGGGESTYGPM